MRMCETIQNTVVGAAGAAAVAGLAAASGALVATTATAGLIYGASSVVAFTVFRIAGECFGIDARIRPIAAVILAILAATICTSLILGIKISAVTVYAGILLAGPAALGAAVALFATEALLECCRTKSLGASRFESL